VIRLVTIRMKKRANRPDPPLDRLDALLRHFSVSARLFHSGPLCGVTDFAAGEPLGYLHVIRDGGVEVRHRRGSALRIDEPTLLLYPRPLWHRFVTDARRGADMACARVAFSGGDAHPVARALPPMLLLPLARLPGVQPTVELLFAEAFGQACGRQAAVDRLFEVLVIQLLRRLLDEGTVDSGLLAGLSDPRLARALVGVHEAPARHWSLEALARRAGMSRSRFAGAFRATVGDTPGAYLAGWRVSLAQALLRRGRPLKSVATEVGYGGSAALARVFRARTGQSPRQWLRGVAPGPDLP
jgi:AraC-like DNA-binding protein